jgi:hypothetical protein
VGAGVPWGGSLEASEAVIGFYYLGTGGNRLKSQRTKVGDFIIHISF